MHAHAPCKWPIEAGKIIDNYHPKSIVRGVYLRMAKRVLLETDKRLLWKFAYTFGWRGMRSVQRFKKGLKKGECFPPFLYISVLNSCN
ncbi:uncharacterized protein METZ01_LOCUS491244, partial [marine metagenome]